MPKDDICWNREFSEISTLESIWNTLTVEQINKIFLHLDNFSNSKNYLEKSKAAYALVLLTSKLIKSNTPLAIKIFIQTLNVKDFKGGYGILLRFYWQIPIIWQVLTSSQRDEVFTLLLSHIKEYKQSILDTSDSHRLWHIFSSIGDSLYNVV